MSHFILDDFTDNTVKFFSKMKTVELIKLKIEIENFLKKKAEENGKPGLYKNGESINDILFRHPVREHLTNIVEQMELELRIRRIEQHLGFNFNKDLE